MNSKFWSIYAFIVLVLLSACMPSADDDFQQLVERDNRLITEFLAQNNINATETTVGYYYKKDVSNNAGRQIVNGDTIGVYYEIKTINGQLIESYLDESQLPRLYFHGESGLVPRGINFASSLAREGETLTLYIPTYLAFADYSFQQLIPPSAILEVKIKFAKIFNKASLAEHELQHIEQYLNAGEGITGFSINQDGLFVKEINPGQADGKVATTGGRVRFTYEIFQLDAGTPFAAVTNPANPVQITLGSTNNIRFLNLALEGTQKDQEFEVISPSDLAFGATTQVFPYAARLDLFQRGLVPEAARPFEPVRIKIKVIDVL